MLLDSQSASSAVEAFGECKSVKDWAAEIGVDIRVLKQRLEIVPAEIALSMPRMTRLHRFGISAGEPQSWTWDLLPWRLDLWAQAFVAERPSGATLEEVGEALGVTRERVRQIETSAMRKLKRTKEGQRLACLLREHQHEEVEVWRWR